MTTPRTSAPGGEADEIGDKADLAFETGSGQNQLGFRVEAGKKRHQKISMPVLFGQGGTFEKSFEADAHHPDEGFIVEVEAGRAVVNNQFLKDIFQACVMADVHYLAIAVRNDYRGADDFQKVVVFLETLYTSGRLQLPLKGILLVGY